MVELDEVEAFDIKIPPYSAKKVPNTKLVMADNLIKMLIDGPLVSLSGSPTVSPTTAALWASECLTKRNFPSTSSPWTSLE